VSGSVVVPASDSPTFAVSGPFTIDDSSILIGYASDPSIAPAQELFRLEVRGGGTGTVELNTVVLPDATRVYTARSIGYVF
jgi:hypothetical protein